MRRERDRVRLTKEDEEGCLKTGDMNDGWAWRTWG
jgi:hypothetical protein